MKASNANRAKRTPTWVNDDEQVRAKGKPKMQLSTNLPYGGKRIRQHLESGASLPVNVSREADRAFMAELQRTDPGRYARLEKAIQTDLIHLPKAARTGTESPSRKSFSFNAQFRQKSIRGEMRSEAIRLAVPIVGEAASAAQPEKIPPPV